MSDETPTTPDDPRFGEFAPDEGVVGPRDNPEDRDPGPAIPVQDWVPEPVYDSSDYLDREAPLYVSGDGDEEEEVEGEDEAPEEKPSPGQREPGESER